MVRCGDEILLIQNTYGSRKWTLPGGGVKRGEAPERAARREVEEEAGIVLDAVEPIGEIFSDREYKRDYVYCFWARVKDKTIRPDRFEICAAEWFSVNNLPEVSPTAEKILELYKKRF